MGVAPGFPDVRCDHVAHQLGDVTDHLRRLLHALPYCALSQTR